METTTIAALATPPGTGGIAIVRLSGPEAESLLRKVFKPASSTCAWDSHVLMYGKVMDKDGVLDECMAVLMRAPRSYTREDVAELHLHGGEYIARSVLKLLFSLGARPAEAGEFTRRAFLNGRLDLSRAEAVMSLISAKGAQASRAAVRQLEGGTMAFVRSAQEKLTGMLAAVSAALDFPDEVDEAETAAETAAKARELSKTLADACDERGARLLNTGLEVTICGMPNVGKSSLFNALMMEERAIVTDEPGTTRDLLHGSILLDGLRVNLCDTAGIRETVGLVEQIGVERARGAVGGADLLLLVIDGSVPVHREAQRLMQETEGRSRVLLQSKADLNRNLLMEGAILFSAKTGEGLEEVKRAIAEAAGTPEDSTLTLERHMVLAREAAAHLDEAAEALERGDAVDLCAVHLDAALQSLGRVTGDRVDEQLLDAVFSTFCVGK